jgi:SAM-dependent methyltransferase
MTESRNRVLLPVVFFLGVLPVLLNMSGLFVRRNRTTLPQVMANKFYDDRVLVEEDKSHWYAVDPAAVGDWSLVARYVEMNADEETEAFLAQCIDKSDSFLTQIWHNLAKNVMKLFYYTQTDINGYLGRGSMFVLSEDQFMLLAEKAGIKLDKDQKFDRMIDLGAGDGCPTRFFAPFFADVYATEASKAMRNVLTAKDISVLEIDTWHEREDKFDFVACLNLLDRCAEPATVLSQIRSALKPDGFVIVAMVLPFKPYVEFNSSDNKPVEKLDIVGDTFEAQVKSAAKALETEGGFSVLSWTRVPYLCEGDLSKSVYSLDDCIFVLKAKDMD